jgi:hypothetical protein
LAGAVQSVTDNLNGLPEHPRPPAASRTPLVLEQAGALGLSCGASGLVATSLAPAHFLRQSKVDRKLKGKIEIARETTLQIFKRVSRRFVWISTIANVLMTQIHVAPNRISNSVIPLLNAGAWRGEEALSSTSRLGISKDSVENLTIITQTS